jgi:pyruvate/2-oxoglutarate dehydrogenase complex dihydrolipoamide dehydrogenase (E3) component
MKWYADWLRNEIRDLNVEVKMNHAPTSEELMKYDVVLNCTGAVSYIPEVLGHKEKVVPFEEAIACPKSTCEFYPKGSNRKNRKLGEKVIIWGDHYAAADMVAFLGAAGKDVTVVTDRKEFGSSVEVIHMYVLRKRMAQSDAEALHSRPYKYPVKVLQSSTIYEIGEKEAIIIDNKFNHHVIEFDDIVTCYTKTNSDLAETLEKVKAAGIPVFAIGDAKSPRNLHAAVKEGADFIVKILDKDLLINPNGAIAGNLPPDVRIQLGLSVL